MGKVLAAMESSSKKVMGRTGQDASSLPEDKKKPSTSKRPLEYLFFGGDPKASASWDGRELLQIAAEGFQVRRNASDSKSGAVGGGNGGTATIGAEAFTSGGLHSGGHETGGKNSQYVRLTNAFSQADLPRTRHYVNHIARKLQDAGRRITGDFKGTSSSSWAASASGEEESSSVRIAEELEMGNLRKIRPLTKGGNEGMEDSARSVLRSCRKGFLSLPEGRILIAKVFLGKW